MCAAYLFGCVGLQTPDGVEYLELSLLISNELLHIVVLSLNRQCRINYLQWRCFWSLSSVRSGSAAHAKGATIWANVVLSPH